MTLEKWEDSTALGNSIYTTSCRVIFKKKQTKGKQQS